MEESWLRYVSSFPHVARYFKAAPEYIHHKGSRKLNLYTLFLERCFRLLHDTGHCGIVMPDGIYNAYGTRGLREMLFDKTKVTALFGFENSGGIFEDVHRQFEFVILTFEKAGTTERFPAAFMRHDPKELERFPDEGAIEIEVDAVRRMASESLGTDRIHERDGPPGGNEDGSVPSAECRHRQLMAVRPHSGSQHHERQPLVQGVCGLRSLAPVHG